MLYREMQGKSRNAWRKTYYKLLKALYPKSGYSSETGGNLHNLNTSTTRNEKVRAYHRKLYRAENLTIIISGKVTPEKVFFALKPIQESIKNNPKGEVFERPWQSPLKKISQSQDIKVNRRSYLNEKLYRSCSCRSSTHLTMKIVVLFSSVTWVRTLLQIIVSGQSWVF